MRVGDDSGERRLRKRSQQNRTAFTVVRSGCLPQLSTHIDQRTVVARADNFRMLRRYDRQNQPARAWRYVYRAVDEHGQVVDVYVSKRRNIAAARQFFTAALTAHEQPDEVATDLSPALAHIIAELLPTAFHHTERYANNRVECDHGHLKARLRPMCGLKTDRTARVIIGGHAFIQNLRRGPYELGVQERNRHLLVAAAFDELGGAI